MLKNSSISRLTCLLSISIIFSSTFINTQAIYTRSLQDSNEGSKAGDQLFNEMLLHLEGDSRFSEAALALLEDSYQNGLDDLQKFITSGGYNFGLWG